MSSTSSVRVLGDEIRQIGQQPAIDQLDRRAEANTPTSIEFVPVDQSVRNFWNRSANGTSRR